MYTKYVYMDIVEQWDNLHQKRSMWLYNIMCSSLSSLQMSASLHTHYYMLCPL